MVRQSHLAAKLQIKTKRFGPRVIGESSFVIDLDLGFGIWQASLTAVGLTAGLAAYSHSD